MLVAAHELDVDSGSEQVYNGLDCVMTYEILEALTPQRSQAQPAYNFELALQAPVLDMMLRGFAVDPGARELGIQSTRRDLQRLDVIIQSIATAIWHKGLNPNSGLQLRNFFYEHLGLVPIQTHVKGEIKTPMDRKVLEKLSDYFIARPIVNAILDHRDLTKQLQVLETEVDIDWRMRTSYNIGGTVEGRFSSSKSPTGSGTNLQNISEGLRHIFIADKDHNLYGIDLEQSDSRMVGFMCGLLFGDWTYLDACESGDLHTFVARMTWKDLPWTGDLKKDKAIAKRIFYRHFSFRDASKRLGHGVNFLGKPYTMSQETHIPVKLVAAFIEGYFGAFPCIQKWQHWTAGQLQTKQRLTSIYGRTRDFFDRPAADETLRKGLAYLAAAPTADNLNLGMLRIWQQMPEVKLLAQVHDAIYFEAHKDLEPAAIVAKAQRLLEVPLFARGRRFVVPSEAKIGSNWGNFDEKTNPRGLQKLAA